MTDDEVEWLARYLAALSQNDRSSVLRRLRAILLVGQRLRGGSRRDLRRDIGSVLYDARGLAVAVLVKWSLRKVRDPLAAARPWQSGEDQYDMQCEEITNDEFAEEIYRRESERR